MDHPSQEDVTAQPVADKAIVRWKLATFAASTALLLLVQYLAAGAVSGAWDMVLLLLLAHSAVMLTDAVCELYDERAPRWKNVVTGFLLPVEPRGFSNVLMMIGLFVVIALAIQIRGCDEAREPEPPRPAPEDATIETGWRTPVRDAIGFPAAPGLAVHTSRAA